MVQAQKHVHWQEKQATQLKKKEVDEQASEHIK